MMIEMFGYRFYPAFFILIGIIIITIIGGFLLFKVLKNRKSKKSLIVGNKNITSWQKRHLPPVIEEEINNYIEDKEYCEVLNDILSYINDSLYWDTEELLKVNNSSILILTELITNKALFYYKENNSDFAVLLLHAIDCINGTIENINGRKEWITNDIPEASVLLPMPAQEKRLIYVCASAIQAVTTLINPKTEKISEFSGTIPELKVYSKINFEDALEELLSCNTFKEINYSSREISICAMFQLILDLIKNPVAQVYREFEIFDFRILACLIDNQTYEDILNTIE